MLLGVSFVRFGDKKTKLLQDIQKKRQLNFVTAQLALSYLGFKETRCRGSHHWFGNGTDTITVAAHGKNSNVTQDVLSFIKAKIGSWLNDTKS